MGNVDSKENDLLLKDFLNKKIKIQGCHSTLNFPKGKQKRDFIKSFEKLMPLVSKVEMIYVEGTLSEDLNNQSTTIFNDLRRCDKHHTYAQLVCFVKFYNKAN